MTSRQARKLRREQERKAKKAAYKAGLQATAQVAPAAALPVAPAHLPPCDDDDFSPEVIAYANAMRERVSRRVTPRAASLASDPTPTPGFVSQTSLSPAEQPEPPASPRAAINRANAQHSTGPSTPEGKLASSRNSLKHGLASGTLIIPGEDQAAFASLLDSLLAEHQPANATEEMLIREMAQSFWLTQRALRLQNECFTEDAVNEKRLALFLRYYTTHQRAFHKALNTLIRLQKERRRAAIHDARGFVSQRDTSPHPKTGFVSQNDPSTAANSRSAPRRALR